MQKRYQRNWLLELVSCFYNWAASITPPVLALPESQLLNTELPCMKRQTKTQHVMENVLCLTRARRLKPRFHQNNFTQELITFVAFTPQEPGPKLNFRDNFLPPKNSLFRRKYLPEYRVLKAFYFSLFNICSRQFFVQGSQSHSLIASIVVRHIHIMSAFCYMFWSLYIMFVQ